MKYAKLIFNIALAFSSVSVQAGTIQSFIPQEVMAKVGPVAEKARRVAKKSAHVAKVGAYGALAGVAGAAMVVPLMLCKTLAEDRMQDRHDTVKAVVLASSSFFGLGVAMLYFAQKTQQAYQELKTV